MSVVSLSPFSRDWKIRFTLTIWKYNCGLNKNELNFNKWMRQCFTFWEILFQKPHHYLYLCLSSLLIYSFKKTSDSSFSQSTLSPVTKGNYYKNCNHKITIKCLFAVKIFKTGFQNLHEALECLKVRGSPLGACFQGLFV